MPKRVVGLLETSGPVNDNVRDIKGVALPLNNVPALEEPENLDGTPS